jgi:hypothetical protein
LLLLFATHCATICGEQNEMGSCSQSAQILGLDRSMMVDK